MVLSVLFFAVTALSTPAFAAGNTHAVVAASTGSADAGLSMSKPKPKQKKKANTSKKKAKTKKKGHKNVHPGVKKGFNPQPEPPGKKINPNKK